MPLQDLPLNDIVMDIDNIVINNIDNFNEVKGCTMTFNKNSYRTVSILSSKASVNYTTRMERLNNISEETVYKELIDCSQLEVCPQCGSTNKLALKSTLI